MTRRIHFTRAGMALAVGLAFAAAPGAAQAAPTVGLGTADSFSVLAGSTVTNTGSSVLTGDLGVSPGSAITGFPPGTVIGGTTHTNDGVALQAQSDTTIAYNDAAGRPATSLGAVELGGTTKVGGAYTYPTLGLNGTLTLDGQNDPDSVFVFQAGSTLITGSNSTVQLINGAQACNVFWQIGSSATLGTTTTFVGNIMANQSITLNNGASLQGRALARNAAVTLDNNVVTRSVCATATPTPTPTPTPTSPTSTTPTSTTPTPTGSPASGGTPSTGTTAPPASRSTVPTRNGSATLRPTSRSGSASDASPSPFGATVRGRQIKRVVFSVDGKRVASRPGSPLSVSVRSAPGPHKLTARVTFKDATRARTLTLRYRASGAVVLQPRRGPSRFTG